MYAQEDELVSRLRELNRTAAAASVKRLSQANGDPALDVRHVIALSNEELERVIAEARRLQEFLSSFLVVPPELIPPTSILREFIGNSGFLY